MTWDSLIRETAGEAELTLKTTRSILEKAFVRIADSAIHGGRIAIPGFGAFFRRTRKARVVRDIKTKELIKVPSVSHVAFRAARSIRR